MGFYPLPAQFRLAVSYVDRILKGEKPADRNVEVAELSVIGGVELSPVSSASTNADRLAGA
jgi:hypothetical protein